MTELQRIDQTWGAKAPECPPLEWRPVWFDERHGRWQVEEATRESDGWTRPNLRPVLGAAERAAWLTPDQMVALIATGRLRCGISLAALADARTWERRS